MKTKEQKDKMVIITMGIVLLIILSGLLFRVLSKPSSKEETPGVIHYSTDNEGDENIIIPSDISDADFDSLMIKKYYDSVK